MTPAAVPLRRAGGSVRGERRRLGLANGWCKFSTAALFLFASFPALAQIQVTAATYGGNANAALHGNATAQLAAACVGKMTCAYSVLWTTWGDVALGTAKDFVAQWTCVGDPTPRTATVPAEAGYGSVVNLSCSAGLPLSSQCVAGQQCYRLTLVCVPARVDCPAMLLYVRTATGVQIMFEPVLP